MQANAQTQKEITHLAAAVLAAIAIMAIIIGGSPCHGSESFCPEILMILIPGAYCFYALRQILSLKLRSFLLFASLIAAIAILSLAKTIPPPEEEETKKKKPDLRSDQSSQLTPQDNRRDFKSISKSFREGFH